MPTQKVTPEPLRGSSVSETVRWWWLDSPEHRQDPRPTQYIRSWRPIDLLADRIVLRLAALRAAPRDAV